MSECPRIWLTRPHADSALLAKTLAAHGVEGVIAPVLTIASCEWAVPHEMPDALVITSRHAAAALAQLPHAWRTLPVFCVGMATARAVQAQGFPHCLNGDAGGEALVPLMHAQLPPRARLLHLSGREVRDAWKQQLPAFSFATVTVYQAKAVRALSPTLTNALEAGGIHGVALFSPRTARLVVELCTSHTVSLAAYAFSDAVAEAAASAGWRAVHVAQEPTVEAMVDLMVSTALPTML